MKLNDSSRTYITLAGVGIAIIALVVYMWIDTRNLGRSKAPETEAEVATEAGDAVAVRIGVEDVSMAIPGESIERRPSRQQDRIRQKKLANATEKPLRSQSNTHKGRSNTRGAGNSDDWMFEKGMDVEEQSTDSRSIPTIE